MKYRKRPVVVEARQWIKEGDHPDVGYFRYPPVDPETGEITAGEEGVFLGQLRHSKAPQKFRRDDCHALMSDHGHIDTLEGGHIVCPYDYVITGLHGERYPCKPDIFAKTYEVAE